MPDDSTIPSHLQELLARTALPRPPRVYNFGRGYYFSTQERALFEKLLYEGRVPDAALFVDGSNDTSVFPTFGGPRFTDSFVRMSAEIGNPPPFRLSLPLVRFLAGLREAAPRKRGPRRHDIDTAIERYVRTKRTIAAVAREFGVVSIFAWHPVASYKYDRSHHHLVTRIGTGRKYARMARYVAKYPLGNDFIWCADVQERIPRNLYVDRVHFNAEGARLVAQHIVDVAAERRLLGPFSGS